VDGARVSCELTVRNDAGDQKIAGSADCILPDA
jgi:hypothetical protein